MDRAGGAKSLFAGAARLQSRVRPACGSTLHSRFDPADGPYGRLMSEHLLMQPVSPPAPQRTPPSPPPVAAVPARSRMPGGDRRKQLLRVAIEIFARNGFSGTKTKDIAAAAGVREAIALRHLPTKEDLYHAILDEREDAVTASEFRREMEQR